MGAGCVIYGAYLQKTGQTAGLRMLLVRVSELDFSFIPRYAQSTTAKVDRLAVDIKFTNHEKIRYFREMALDQEMITEEMQEEVPAKIRYTRSYLSGWVEFDRNDYGTCQARPINGLYM